MTDTGNEVDSLSVSVLNSWLNLLCHRPIITRYKSRARNLVNLTFKSSGETLMVCEHLNENCLLVNTITYCHSDFYCVQRCFSTGQFSIIDSALSGAKWHRAITPQSRSKFCKNSVLLDSCMRPLPWASIYYTNSAVSQPFAVSCYF